MRGKNCPYGLVSTDKSFCSRCQRCSEPDSIRKIIRKHQWKESNSRKTKPVRIEIDIPVRPQPQSRPRFVRITKGSRQFVRAYDSKKCREYKEKIAYYTLFAMRESGSKSPLTGPVSVFMLFYLGEKRDSHGRPDLDNLVKAVKDAMTGVVYRDDSQIVELLAKKKPGKEQIKIVVQELN